MEQARFATNQTDASALLEPSSDHLFLKDARSRDHYLETCLPKEPVMLIRGQYAGPSENNRECDASREFETAAAKQSIPADAKRVNTPIEDYRTLSDLQLLEAARSSDEQAFVELTGRHIQMVHRKIFRILRNREDAEDILQEALFKAYGHLGEFRGTCAFSTWLTRIAINSALMLLRKRRSHSEVSFDQTRGDDQQWAEWEFPDPSPNAEQAYASRQTAGLLACAVKRLPSGYRSLVEQYHGKERSLREAADTLGITVAAAKSRLQRARLTIRSILEESVSPRRAGGANRRGALQNPEQVGLEIRSRFVATTSG